MAHRLISSLVRGRRLPDLKISTFVPTINGTRWLYSLSETTNTGVLRSDRQEKERPGHLHQLHEPGLLTV